MSAPEIWRKSFYAFLRAHSVKVIKSLPKDGTTDSVPQTRLMNKIFSSSLHDLPTKIDLPIKHHKTIILSYPFHVREQCWNYCSGLLWRAYLTLKRFKVQPCKLRSNPVTSHHFHWCSTDLSPDPSTFDTTLSHTQLPRDAPHRSTHQTLTPSSPIWLLWRLSSMMVLLMLKAWAKTWKRWKAERQADDPWQNKHQRLLFQKAFHLHWKLKDWIEVKKRFFLRTNGVQAKKKH